MPAADQNREDPFKRFETQVSEGLKAISAATRGFMTEVRRSVNNDVSYVLEGDDLSDQTVAAVEGKMVSVRGKMVLEREDPSPLPEPFDILGPEKMYRYSVTCTGAGGKDFKFSLSFEERYPDGAYMVSGILSKGTAGYELVAPKLAQRPKTP